MDDYREFYLMQQTYATLFSLSNKLQMQGDRYSDNLTLRQLMAMIAIIHLPKDETTLNNIAKKLGTSKQSVKQLITIIEKKGYVLTTPSKKDKRAVNVEITEDGKRVMLKSSEKSINFFMDVFKDFEADEMELLWGLLKKMYRFDGEEQDGFEEDADLEVEVDQSDSLALLARKLEERKKYLKDKKK